MSSSSLIITTLTLIALPLLWTLVSLVQNYRTARSAKLPVLICPIDPFNPFWMLLRPYINPLLARLPFGLGAFTEYNHLGFMWRDQGRLHEVHGGAYMIVTPGLNQLVVADASAGTEILRSIHTWGKNPAFNEPLKTFGPSVATDEGDAWQRQRKITAVAFSERNNYLVWVEAVRQSRQMLAGWLTKRDVVTSTAEDSYMAALHVLTGAGFGRSYDFDSPLTVPDPGHTMSYRDALWGAMANIFVTYAIAKLGRLSFLLPSSGKRVHRAIVELKMYMRELVDKERSSYSQGGGGSANNTTLATNLMSSLVRASESEARTASGKSRNALTDEEFLGNLFIFNVAGHDTTAATLAYAIGLLACNPRWQDWIKCELDEVFGEREVTEDEYETAFPRLKRCLAIMYETLRLYAPLNGIPRYTGSTPKTLALGSDTYIIPGNTFVFVNNAAVQMDEQYWGPDRLEWNPSRWLREPSSPSSLASTPGEVPVQLAENSYLPWSSGPRVCPGKKFSQVEHTAALAVLFHHHRVHPVVLPGETEEHARGRIQRVVMDSDMVLAMRMNHPEELKVRWVKDP
ncbi:hypothetical protein LTS17_006190 [Exophiala oligosperma]